ncbi:MAG: radical SAM protein [Xanthobacteraceae bacterium]|nr:radical SAM protein [Xanthobacteraceae bacterium]
MNEAVATPKPLYGFADEHARAFPQTIVVETTNVCNLRCIHCPQGQGLPESPNYRAEYMPWDVYKKLIDEISQHKITLVRISPAGEALVHPQFLDQIAYAKAKGVGPIDLTTNALTFDNQAIENGERVPGKSILDRLIDHGLDVVDISLDAATKDAYERIRVRSNYHRVWANLHRLLYLREQKKSPMKVMLSIVDQPEAAGEVEQFVKYWTPLVDRVLVRPYLPNLGLTGRKPGDIGEKQSKIERWPCPQFWKRVTITPEGDIRFCVVDWLDKSKVGNVRTHSIAELWRGAEYERMRGCHLGGKYAEAHPICGPCTDWMGMRWDWGFEMAIRAAFGDKSVPDKPAPLEQVYGKA